MSGILTMKEIEKRFDKEWVLIEDPICSKSLNVKKGKVLWHSKDKVSLYKKAQELKPKDFAVLFIGERPDELVYML